MGEEGWERGREGGGEGEGCFFFDFLVPPWGPVHSGDAGFAVFSPFVYRVWVTKVYLPSGEGNINVTHRESSG